MLGHEGLQGIIENTCAVIGGITGFSIPNVVAYYLSNDWNEFDGAAGAFLLLISLPFAGMGFIIGGLIGEEIYHSISRRRDYKLNKKILGDNSHQP